MRCFLQDAKDSLLDGGLYTGEIAELAGQSSTGKTQLCMCASVSVVMANNKNTVAYIDSSGTFSPERIVDIYTAVSTTAETPPKEPDAQDTVRFLNHIECFKCFDVFSLIGVLCGIEECLKQKDIPYYRNLKFIVIDSLGALISPILGGKQTQGHALMINIARTMKAIAKEHHIAFVVTNHTVTFKTNKDNNLRPALGESWSFVPNTRLILANEQHQQHVKKATLTKSSRLAANQSVLFKIAAEGIIPLNSQ